MTLGSKDHEEIVAMFERVYPHLRLDKETKEMRSRGYIYQNGETNNLFLAFRHGAAFGRVAL